MKRATWFQVTNNFLPAWRVFWRSLLQYHPRDLFGDVYIQCEEIPELPEADDRFYYRPLVLNRYRSWPAFERRITACYAKIEALELQGYDELLVLDSDMVCTGSIAEIFDAPGPFVGVGVNGSANPRKRFNGGLWIARQPVLGSSGVMDAVEQIGHAGKIFDKCDQSALLVYLESRGIVPELLPCRFNLQIGFAGYSDTRHIYREQRPDCRILHFTGPNKAWSSKPPAMGVRERWRATWELAATGQQLTPADVPEAA